MVRLLGLFFILILNSKTIVVAEVAIPSTSMEVLNFTDWKRQQIQQSEPTGFKFSDRTKGEPEKKETSDQLVAHTIKGRGTTHLALTVAQELTVTDYFETYVWPKQNEVFLLEVVKKMQPAEIIEVLKSYRKKQESYDVTPGFGLELSPEKPEQSRSKSATPPTRK